MNALAERLGHALSTGEDRDNEGSGTSYSQIPHLSQAKVPGQNASVVEILAKELRFPHQALELGTELTLVAGQDWAKQLLVNMKHVKYLSSTGFAVLLKLVKQVKDQGGKLKFCNLDPEVRIGADIIGLDKVASLSGTEHEAIKAFAEE
jgi:anti-anti-sigma factor